MAETAVPAKAATAPPAPLEAGRTPGSPGAPSAAPSEADAGRLSGLTDEEQAVVTAEFDAGLAPFEVPLKKPAGEPAAGKPAEEASKKPPSDESAAAEAAGKGAPDGERPADEKKPEPLPFDEELQGLQPLDAKGESAAGDIPDLTTDEAISKAVNPDGKSSVEEQLKNAQGVIGKQSKTVGLAKKLMVEMAPFVQQDEGGEIVGFDLVRIAQKLGDEATMAQLQAAGLKVVPADWGPEQGNLLAEFPPDIVDRLIKSDKSIEDPSKLSFEDKVELIKNDATKLVDLRVEKGRRQLRADQEVQTAVREQNDQMGARLQHLAATDKGFSNLKSGISRWNNVLPESISGALRAEVTYRLAKLDRVLDPGVRKAQSEAIYKRAEVDIMAKFNLVVPAGGGGVVPAGGPTGGGDEFAAVAKDDEL